MGVREKWTAISDPAQLFLFSFFLLSCWCVEMCLCLTGKISLPWVIAFIEQWRSEPSTQPPIWRARLSSGMFYFDSGANIFAEHWVVPYSKELRVLMNPSWIFGNYTFQLLQMFSGFFSSEQSFIFDFHSFYKPGARGRLLHLSLLKQLSTSSRFFFSYTQITLNSFHIGLFELHWNQNLTAEMTA